MKIIPFNNWLNSINSPTVMLGRLKPNVGTPLEDSLVLLKTELLSHKLERSSKKVIFDFYLGLAAT